MLYKDNEDRYRLSEYLIQDGQFYDGDYELWEEFEIVDEIEGLCWVTDPRHRNGVENHFITYGNEPSAGYAYGHVVVIAQRTQSGN